MKRKPAELKRLARARLTKHYGIPMAALVVSEIILMLLTIPFSWNVNINSSVSEWVIYYVANFAITLLGVVMSTGVLRILLNMARGQSYEFTNLFYGFRNHPDRYILSYLLLIAMFLIPVIPAVIAVLIGVLLKNFLLLVILTTIAIVLLLVGVVILSLCYSLVFFLLVDHADMGVLEAFRTSRRLMNGNKARMFYLLLTFIGLAILGILSIGIGFLWISPYMMETQTFFYLEVSGELE